MDTVENISPTGFSHDGEYENILKYSVLHKAVIYKIIKYIFGNYILAHGASVFIRIIKYKDNLIES